MVHTTQAPTLSSLLFYSEDRKVLNCKIRTEHNPRKTQRMGAVQCCSGSQGVVKLPSPEVFAKGSPSFSCHDSSLTSMTSTRLWGCDSNLGRQEAAFELYQLSKPTSLPACFGQQLTGSFGIPPGKAFLIYTI